MRQDCEDIMDGETIAEETNQSIDFNIGNITSSIKKDLENSGAERDVPENSTERNKEDKRYVLTGIPGFDKLFKRGIPSGANILLSGSPGSGKTIFCLQMIAHHAAQGKKCLYISFEESKEKLMDHMKDFGWNPEELIESGNLKINRYLTTDIYYETDSSSAGVQAMMARNSDHLLLDLEPFIIGADGYKPDITVIDSLTAVSSTFIGKGRSYRFYVERLFRFFEKIGSTNFLTTEPTQKSGGSVQTSSEEFLSDGVIVFYNAKRGNIRESAIEVLKMRGAKHEKKIVAMHITDNGIVVHPEQEVFGDIEK